MEKLTPAQVRALFPATARACYLNAAAASPIALPVEKAIVDHYRDAVDWGDTHFESWLRRREDVRGDFARFIGAQPNEVAFLANTSTGIHLVGQFLRQRGITEVVTLEGEFPSTTVPLLNQGFNLRLVRRRPDGTYSLDDLETSIGPRTGALVASAVQYASGFRLDLARASALCRAKKLLFVVNGAQGLGQVPIDVEAHGIDFLCGTGHKWMMGGYGVGLFYGRASVVAQGELPQGGWLSVERPLAMDNLAGAQRRGGQPQPFFEASGPAPALRHEASALEVGTSAFGTLFGFGEAVKVHAQVGIDTTQAHNRALQASLRRRLRERGFVPNLSDDPAHVAGICVIPVQGEARAAVRELAKHGVVVTPRGEGLRISTHVFNTEEDLEQLFWGLERAGIQPAPGRAP